MEYTIISSGSKGNSVVVNKEIMFDAGVPFNKMKEYLYDVKYLILTHTHGDHMKKKTLQKIMERFPTIKIIGNYEVHQVFPVNMIANAGYPVVTEDYIFTPFLCVHDVLCYGYTFTVDGKHVIYATDTASMEHAPKGKYDYFFIESNHCEEKLKKAISEYKDGYNPYTGGSRHLSTQKAKNFYYANRKNADAHFIELHKSNRFY